jgi:chemotaxis protein histidine kinase CheA
MNDFRQNFLAESVYKLTILQTELAGDLTDNLRRSAFRTIHTIKGGAQAFGLANSARLANDLENILAKTPHQTDKDLLLEGIGVLAKYLQQNEPDSPPTFTGKPQSAAPKTAAANVLLANIPPAVFKNFSEQERGDTIRALREGKNIYCAEVGFDVSNFADQYRKLRKILGEKSDILASLPGEKHKSAGRIGFRIFLATRETVEDLQNSVSDFDAEISSHACSENDSKELYEMLSQIAAHGESIAENLGKQIGITILSNDVALLAEKTKAFFEILMHLVRNAVDHAIERSGTIEVRFFDEGEELYLSVADDGKGIDLTNVRARAVERNLISDEDFLNDQQTLELIFAPKFSTAETVTEISGRGVGLDAVKSAVEKMNGKISVRNRKTTGAIFEIFVPAEKL